MADIELRHLRKEFGRLVAVNDVSLTFDSSKVTCLLGPSGCGKTTLMRMIAGLETPTRGEIFFDGQPVTELSPSERNIGMVFQYPVVYQGISVRRNVELPLLSVRGLSRAERMRRVQAAIELLRLEDVAHKDVSQLPHAVKQKVAVARTIARQPRIILFDEPVTNVDAITKSQLKWALKQLTRDLKQTIIYVTHDQTEAMTLADEIMLMNDGRIIQRGAPRDVYNFPAHQFSGWFLGNPGMNFVPHEVRNKQGNSVIVGPLFNPSPVSTGLAGHSKVVIGIRPERVQVSTHALPGSIESSVAHVALAAGGQQLLTLRLGGVYIKAKVPSGSTYQAGDTLYITCPIEAITVFSESGERLKAFLQSHAYAS